MQRQMRIMGLRAIYRGPRTSQPAPEHRVYPYLLAKADISRPNQGWAADITYLPMARGFLYLVAIMDWHSRYMVAWRLSNTLEAGFYVDALQEALGEGRPEVFNTDQGSQFTGGEFTQVLQDRGVKISMDGKGRYSANIFVEWLWRTVKYEEVYLKAYTPRMPAGNWATTSGSTTTRDPIRPWDTGPQPKCSTGPSMPQVSNQRQGKVHRNRSWYHRQERWDSRLIPPPSCPNNGFHFTFQHEWYNLSTLHKNRLV